MGEQEFEMVRLETARIQQEIAAVNQEAARLNAASTQVAAAAGQLDGVRAVAARWATAIGTFTGVSAIVALFQGFDAVEELNRTSEKWIAGVLCFALVAAVGAAVSAVFAAGNATDKIDADLTLSFFDRSARTVRRWLLVSIGATVAAVVAVTVSVLIAWFGGYDDPAVQAYRVKTTAGSYLCGTLQRGDQGALSLVVETGDPVVLTAVESLTEIGSCPD